MRTSLSLGLGAGLAAGAALASLCAADGSAVAAGRRLVRFEHGELMPVLAQAGGRGATNYVLDYKVTNTGAQAVRPRLRFELRTGGGKTYADVFDTATFRAATKALGRSAEPLSTASIRGAELAAGAAADGLANFGAVDPNADDLEVRVYGLWDPVYRDRQGRTWTERRVLVLSYSRTGDEYDRQYDPIRLRSSKEEIEGEARQLHVSQ